MKTKQIIYPAVTLEQATLEMNKQETAMKKFVDDCGGFIKMSRSQEVLHNRMCAHWDLLKGNRNRLKENLV